ncbi:GNAT family N-acetyltransferase [Actinoplanes sp. DH11]|uniref:GNAT family N-acetyltransferase n=1 Tax=Actinoplanes sp. DH11 TaxID=2857011 RepID=UPI001E460625|nr:GNAT family N-acetyltransferase [Actinoplanes sp. DH11]
MTDQATMPDDTHVDLAGVVTAWTYGWALSRGVPPPQAMAGAARLEVGLPGHRVRYVAYGHDEGLLTELGRHRAKPGTWIKAATEPARLRATLGPAWTMADTGFLMTTSLADAPVNRAAEPYTLRVTASAGVTVAAVLDPAGTTAATGRLAAWNGYGIVDQVETAPAYRRRGLGSTVMTALATRAARHGVHTGVLVATTEGRDLYRSLGWGVRSPIAAAHVPEP